MSQFKELGHLRQVNLQICTTPMFSKVGKHQIVNVLESLNCSFPSFYPIVRHRELNDNIQGLQH